MKKILFPLFLVFIPISFLIAQSANFSVKLDPVSIDGLGGLQAYVYGRHEGKWLLIGGRLDGLHQRQPFASFDVAGNNNRLYVVDPATLKQWSVPLTNLPVALREQLSSTNMEFHQDGKYLYIVGGYGYNNASSSRKTFPSMIAVDVPGVVNAIVQGDSFKQYFRSVADEKFAVAGGHLNKIYETYYLIGGNRFDGNYNPMGHATYTQTYTNSIRKFTIADDGFNLLVQHIAEINDTASLHRRDYNAVDQILPDGSEGITAFSGVFQTSADLPYLNCVNIDSQGYSVNSQFEQHYNHYHCPVLPLYSAGNNEMHTLFFGGIAQFYDNNGTLVRDDNVPFVKTIARVTRTSDGVMKEYKLPVEMPGYLGASAEFIATGNLPQYSNGVFNLDSVSTDTTLMGYIFGGINSSDKNIFFINDGSQSAASPVIYKVYLVPENPASIEKTRTPDPKFNFRIYPNPNNGHFIVDTNDTELHRAVITDIRGVVIQEFEFSDKHNEFSINTIHDGVYFMIFYSNNGHFPVRFIVNN